jgi:predicted membrane-bound spermidine synthase
VQTGFYVPLVLVAFVSGLELPALIELGKTKGGFFSVLAWDYFGMFAGCLAYPLWMIFYLGVFGSAGAAVLFNVLSIFLFLISPRSSFAEIEIASDPSVRSDLF